MARPQNYNRPGNNRSSWLHLCGTNVMLIVVGGFEPLVDCQQGAARWATVFNQAEFRAFATSPCGNQGTRGAHRLGMTDARFLRVSANRAKWKIAGTALPTLIHPDDPGTWGIMASWEICAACA